MYIKSMEELESFFADLVARITGLPDKMVLVSNTRYGRPAFGITDDIAFISISPETDERETHKNRSEEYNAATETYTVTHSAQRTFTLRVVFYGSEGYRNATLLAHKLFLEEYRHAIRAQHMALIPAWTTGPVRLPEAANGQWWERCDISFRFYDYVSVDETVNTFKRINITIEEDI